MIASIMISSSEMGYVIILMMRPAHRFFQNKNKRIYTSVGKGETHNRKKNDNKNVKRNT
ncbi:MAG: hypothetical protein KGD58_08550 [Candidatus Lokiarchaeota archaeon]|nr:hypothetical protein [Candidatus Lokiarchaeota archaeon]